MQWRPCPHTGSGGSCPHLVNAENPCPTHGRPANAPWSPHRSPDARAEQDRLRSIVLKRDRFTCQRCGHEDPTGKTLQVHHKRGADDPRPEHATTLCSRKANGCHAAVDHWAR